MPCTSRYFCFDFERTKPSKLPRGCRPCPPQLAVDNIGTSTLFQSGMRLCQNGSLSSFRLRQSS